MGFGLREKTKTSINEDATASFIYPSTPPNGEVLFLCNKKALGAESEGLRTREVLYEEAEQNL